MKLIKVIIALVALVAAKPLIYDCDTFNDKYMHSEKMPHLFKRGYVYDLGFKDFGVQCVREDSWVNSTWTPNPVWTVKGADTIVTFYNYDHELAAMVDTVPLFKITVIRKPGHIYSAYRSGVDVNGRRLDETIGTDEYCPPRKSKTCALARAFFDMNNVIKLKFR